MSAEEETELKNLVAQTLENKGILPKIRAKPHYTFITRKLPGPCAATLFLEISKGERKHKIRLQVPITKTDAELRANVFLALEENPSTKETLLKNDELSAFVKIPIGTLILNLIREFLEFFELEFTLSVFDPETKYGKEYSSLAKEKMMKDLKLTECKNKSPLLYEVIERVISSDNLRVLSNGKHLEDFGQGDTSGNGDTGQLPSPALLNSTYVKAKSDVDSIPLSPLVKEGMEEENDTIKEELSSNISDSDSLAELNFDKSPRVGNLEESLPSSGSSKDLKNSSSKPVTKNFDEIDLLIFTPVKENKARGNIKPDSQPASNDNKTSEKKEDEKPVSVLGDLPPLTIQTKEKGNKINKIKEIMDKWPGLENDEESSAESKSSKNQLKEEKSSVQLKSDRSEQLQKSDRTDTVDDFEEDISDLINGHIPSEGQATVDETISKTSCEADYLESI